MKKLYVLITVMFFIVSCSSFDEGGTGGGTTELSLGDTVSGDISSVGEVDWYHYRTVDANNVLQVSCSSNTYRPDIELLATVYEEDADGNMVRMYADHAIEGSQLPADMLLNIYIDRPKDIYIAVRDLMDDEADGNPYYVTINFAQADEGNDNFTQAVPIIVDDETSCQTDEIGSIGDIDVYSFMVDDAGAYAVDIDFNPFGDGTEVELSIDLYDTDGVLTASLDRVQSHSYKLLPYLVPGQYFVVINDYGRDDFDPASTYTICVSSTESDELNANDASGLAQDMTYDAATQTFSVTGSLDYLTDQDWYRLPLDTISTVGFKVLQITFDDGDGVVDFGYQIDLSDDTSTSLLSHQFSGGSTAYCTQIKAGSGNHLILVQAGEGEMITRQYPYTLTVQILDIDDPPETVSKIDPDSGDTILGNDTITTADTLLPSANPADATIGKIGYRGDVDWFAVEITDPTVPHILEVYLDTDSQASLVEYYVSVMRDNVVTKMFDTSGSDGADLKTSIYVPASAAASLTYYFRVCDYQGDDGDGTVSYRIRTNITPIPATLPVDTLVGAGDRTYFDEITEKGTASAETVLLEMNSLLQKSFSANTTLLQYNGEDITPGVTKVANGDGTTTITFPWVAGYIDYQGDQDWFKLHLSALIQAGLPLDEDWYYDIQVDLHVDAPGDEVEYIWKLYRDYNDNRILVDIPLDSDGFFASAGDGTLAMSGFDLSTPEAGEAFWAGDEWEGNFYFSVSDFNFVDADAPDGDWGYGGVPYYFRVTLVYHPGVSYPQ